MLEQLTHNDAVKRVLLISMLEHILQVKIDRPANTII